MAGAGIEVRFDEREFQAILTALSRAAMPDLKAIADFAGGELDYIAKQAFEDERDPVTKQPWKELKRPNRSGMMLQGKPADLHRTLIWEAFPDGSVIYGSNKVYARIHQKGGRTGRGHKTLIPARPYMGVPQDFDRRILNDPKVLEWLGMAGGGS
jgi:phage virion morphogenesis protein